MDLPARFTKWTRKLAAATGCRSPILAPARATLSAAHTLSSCRMNASVTRTVRRPEYAWGNTSVDHLEEGVVRDGIEHRAGRRARRDPRRDVLPRLAGIAHSSGQTCRSRDSRLHGFSGPRRKTLAARILISLQ